MLIIHNPAAGWRRGRRLATALAALGAAGIAAELVATNGRGDAESLARQAGSGLAAVVAAGGDGTINEVVNGLMRRPGGEDTPPLGILPLGTANVLARELGLPLDPAAAARVLARGAAGRVRPGLVNGRYFAQMAGIGFDARVVARLPRASKWAFGRSAYVVETLVQLARLRPTLYRVTVDGVPARAASVVIAKGHFYGGGFVLAPAADPAAPVLQACLFERPGRRATARYIAAMLQGRLSRLPDYRVVPAVRVTVEGPEGEPVQGDGDILARLPVEVTVAERPLAVIR